MEDPRPNGFIYPLIDALMRAMESRDGYTVNHQNGVSRLARRIAQELGLSSFEVEGIRVAGQLHDIGKIAIPSQLLTKVDRLHEEELTLVKTHVNRGVEILENIDFPWPILAMVSQHHERLDGSGYPNGLKGDEICLSARILAVADVTDAVINARPYRAALSTEALLTILQDDNDLLYDQEVVSVLHRLILEKGSPHSVSDKLFA